MVELRPKFNPSSGSLPRLVYVFSVYVFPMYMFQSICCKKSSYVLCTVYVRCAAGESARLVCLWRCKEGTPRM